MNKAVQFIVFSLCIIFGQTAQEINEAKKIIEKTGMTKDQIINAAKARGYSDQEINSAIQKEQTLSNSRSGSIPESSENVVLPELGKSNEIINGKPNPEMIVGEMKKMKLKLLMNWTKQLTKSFNRVEQEYLTLAMIF